MESPVADCYFHGQSSPGPCPDCEREHYKSLDGEPRLRPRCRSIWDPDVTANYLASLTPAQRAEQFPNDFDTSGLPYGDF